MEEDSESVLGHSSQDGCGDARGNVAVAEPALSPKISKSSTIHLKNIVKTASLIIY